MREENFLSAAASQMAAGSVFVTVLLFFNLTMRTLQPGVLVLWLVMGPVIYILDYLFLRRERTAQQLTILNTVCCAVLLAGTIVLEGWRGVIYTAIAVAGCIILGVQGANLALKGQTLSRSIQWLDISLILLAVFAALLGVSGISLLWAVPSAVGCVAAVVGLSAYRSGRGQTAAGWVFFSCVLAVLCALAVLLFRFVAGGVGQGVVTVWNSVKAAGSAVYGWGQQLMDWLSSLFPRGTTEETVVEGAVSGDMSGADTTVAFGFTIPVYVYIILAVLVVAVIVFVLLRLRRVRTGHTETVVRRTSGGTRRTRTALGSVFGRRLAWIWEGLRLRVYLYRHRDTALGAFYDLFRRIHGRGWRRGDKQTPREFLSGLLPRAAGDEELSCALTDLIPAVERAMYAEGGADAYYSGAAALRKGRKVLISKSKA